MQHTLLILHILAAAAWIGGTIMLGFAGPRMAKAGGPAAGAWLQVTLDASGKYFMPAAILSLLTGSFLVETNDAWAWSDTFVWIGAVVIVLAIVIGLVVNKPAATAAKEAAEAGDMAAAASNAQRAALGGQIIMFLLIASEILMVTKFGSG
ncbi:MAG: DUF2269 family protein [Actinomycetota bacterium]|nr:DUF2269 family protein [Actinomycetota bacterium]